MGRRCINTEQPDVLRSRSAALGLMMSAPFRPIKCLNLRRLARAKSSSIVFLGVSLQFLILSVGAHSAEIAPGIALFWSGR